MRGWLLAGCFIGVCCGAAVVSAVVAVRLPGPLLAPRDIVVPRGGVAEVAAALQQAGVVSWRLPFEIFAEATWFQGRLRAGEFRVAARANLPDILAILRTGRPVEHLLTIPEGLTAAQIARLLVDEPALDGGFVLPAEGSVLPQTYAFERGASRSGVLARAQAARRAALEDGWRRREPEAALASPREALILASIVERETAVAAERPLVARVFLNRLHRSMRLQSDPTVVFGLSGGLGSIGRTLTRADLREEGPYNTYVVDRLPAGAICSPGAAAVDAVLHPARSDALYFVADGTGGHRFSDTLTEHEQNVRFYRSGQILEGVSK